jgi:hypothetical protein
LKVRGGSWTRAGLLACAILVSIAHASEVKAAAPRWELELHHNPTRFAPAEAGQIWIAVENAGDAPTSGPVTLQIELSGLVRDSLAIVPPSPGWSCPGGAGEMSITCTTNDTIGRRTVVQGPIVFARAEAVAGIGSVEATISGGGAEPASSSELVSIDTGLAGFGLVPDSVDARFLSASGETVEAAGSHPHKAVFTFDLNTVPAPVPDDPDRVYPAGNLRGFTVELPPGFVGDPESVDTCSPAQLVGGTCPPSSQVGRVDLLSYPKFTGAYDANSRPVFNMEHPRGAVADLAFEMNTAPVHIKLSLDPDRGYAVTASASNLLETAPLYALKLTLWGVPGDPAHDSERCDLPDTSSTCPGAFPARPFLALPARCDSAADAVVFREYDSWQRPGQFGPEVRRPTPAGTGCEDLDFEPKLTVSPIPGRPGAPTGLDVGISLAQGKSPDEAATPAVKEARVLFPANLQLSASGAAGLVGCAPGVVGLGQEGPSRCPPASRLGTVAVATPLLPTSLEGSIYLATPGENSAGSGYGVYLVASDREDRGIVLKLSGRLEAHPRTGQVTASFGDLPQLPFERLDLHFRGGPQAIFSLDRSCGAQTAWATFSSWAQPGVQIRSSDWYDVGAAGVGCKPGGFAPRFRAGSLEPVAKASSPFVFHLSRGEDEQEVERLSVELPRGLSADLASVDRCAGSDAVDGACPVGARIGYARATVGSGAAPLLVPPPVETGSVYLGGPYRGSPHSLVIAVPARAGPFDFGEVIVRAAVRLDPRDASIRIEADPLPQRLDGIPLSYRTITVMIDRPGFVVNPSSCKATRVSATLHSSEGLAAKLRDRFQVGGCASLGFQPRVRIGLGAGTGRNGHPALTLDLRSRRSDANLRSAAVLLPKGRLVDPVALTGVCSADELAEDSCPRRAFKGWARAWSPLIPGPIEGPIVLAESRRKYPNLVADLRGAVHIRLVGRMQSANGRIGVKLAGLPDVPLARVRLALFGGRRGLFVNSESLCRARRAKVALRAHNGLARRLARPLAAAPCFSD